MGNLSTAICVSGFVCALIGAGLIWGVGVALFGGGVVMFAAGGLASAREAK